jgi:hypothetical protein
MKSAVATPYVPPMKKKVKFQREFGQVIGELVEEHYQIEREKKAAAENAERNETARRQFLMFLWFAILAASVIYRDDIDACASAIYARYVEGKTEDPRRVAYGKAKDQIADVNKKRQDDLNSIEAGLGGESLAEGMNAATNRDTKDKMKAIEATAKGRQAILDDIEVETRKAEQRNAARNDRQGDL